MNLPKIFNASAPSPIDYDVFIFTEAYNCGLIANKAIESFFQFHDNYVHVIGTPDDFKSITPNEKIVFIDVSKDVTLARLYKEGHAGTAYIFLKAIKEYSKDIKHIIHFDSDVIFRKESISEIKNRFNQGYDLVGPRRCYKHNLNNREDVRQFNDVVHTCFYGFNKEKISKEFSNDLLLNMIVGFVNPLQHPTIDFFDPVSFDIQKNGGQTFYLDYEKFGSQNEEGSKMNKYGELNTFMDVGDNILHFAGVGSGLKFYSKGADGVHPGYVEFALKNFALYYKLVYNKTLKSIQIDNDKYEKLKSLFPKRKKIALLTIATGKYDMFIKPLFDSMKQHFFKNEDVTLFVFSDKKINISDVVVIEEEHRPWPYPTLMRYHMFKRAWDKLSEFEYIFYVDADTKFVSDIGDDILGKYVATRHCGYYKGGGEFENKKNSCLYLEDDKYKHYYGGGFLGGSKEGFKELTDWCATKIDIDMMNGLIPRHNDETAINTFFALNEPDKILSPSYHYPEPPNEFYVKYWEPEVFEPKIMLLTKNHNEVRTV